MSKSFEALRAIDERITNTLTKFCWWTDIHLGKDNVWWATALLVVVDPVLSTTLMLLKQPSLTYLEIFLNFFSAGLINIILMFLVYKYTPWGKIILKNAKNSPNKNQVSYYADVIKISALLNFFLWWGTGLFRIVFDAAPGTDVATFVVIELFVYFLCTEPVPPALKKKKLEEKSWKNQKLNFV